MQICPSILESKLQDYFSTIKKLSFFFNWFHLDFTDGKYVENKTADINDFFNQILNNKYQISSFNFDFHLMIKDYQKVIKKLSNLVILEKIKIKNIFIHYDLRPDYLSLSKQYSLFTIGLTINPQDKINSLIQQYDLKQIKALQIMSVYPGAQGSPFIESSLKKIEQLRLSDYGSKIFLDGAVNDKTLPIINSLKYKPDIICPGSFLTKTKNNTELKNRFDFLKKIINN